MQGPLRGGVLVDVPFFRHYGYQRGERALPTANELHLPYTTLLQPSWSKSHTLWPPATGQPQLTRAHHTSIIQVAVESFTRHSEKGIFCPGAGHSVQLDGVCPSAEVSPKPEKYSASPLQHHRNGSKVQHRPPTPTLAPAMPLVAEFY